MTAKENRAQAIERELEEMRKIVVQFQLLVHDAEMQADALRHSWARLQDQIAAQRDEQLDYTIDNLDRMLGRGKYLSPSLRIDNDDQSEKIVERDGSLNATLFQIGRMADPRRIHHIGNKDRNK